MPAIMNGRMSEHQWESFCNQVDTLIVPLNKLRYLLLAGTIGVFVTFVLVMILSFSSFRSYSSASFDDGSTSPPNIFVYLLIPLALMFGLIGLFCYVSSVAGRAFDKVRLLCEATSRDNRKVSLHLRDDRLVVGGSYSGSESSYRAYHDIYIEASLSDINVVPIIASAPYVSRVGDLPMHDLEANVPVAHATEVPPDDAENSGSGNNKSSVESRIEKLERVKHLLTTQEYEEKRDEILADI